MITMANKKGTLRTERPRLAAASRFSDKAVMSVCMCMCMCMCMCRLSSGGV